MPSTRPARPIEPPRVQRADQVPPGFELMREMRPPSLLRRLLTTQRHLIGLASGSWIALYREANAAEPKPGGLRHTLRGLSAWLIRPFCNRKLAAEPFPVQFRKRLERLGPTYIKLGQILSLRKDLLPARVTDELRNLLDRLPVVTFERYRAILEEELGQPVENLFSSVEATPLGSASIAQIHRAWTRDGEAVILKVVKPGIAETLRRDAVLLRWVGRVLQVFFGRYQPKRVIDEFVGYTEREVDLVREADNAETFQANFRDEPDIVFPKIYRHLSTHKVLCMEFLDGVRPDDQAALDFTESDRDQLIDLGARAIVRMLYRDGFFHADLHPGNLLILPGARCGFIDLGMVGRFDDELRRKLMYYYYCLVIGDSENAARYLTSTAEIGAGSDPTGFRREVEEICRRWSRHANFTEFSLAQLILESVGKAGQYRVYFPVELVLMVKALVTYEGVGQILKPKVDVAKVTKTHISSLFLHQFNPVRIAKEGLRGAPDIVDAIIKAPSLVTEGLRFLERTTQTPQENPLAGLRSSLFAGACVIAGAIIVALKGPAWLAASLFAIGGTMMLVAKPKS